ncbi:MAG: hypothetical protein VB119_01515 [Candidatus Metalachnospira sp.]|nr:hypothetical protein [Candidatus Metalachnospira sp.]
MNRVKSKLKSQSGASILIALMLFLVCAMVGSVVLSSAAGNADKMRNRRSEQQEYLSISSAARLIQNAIGGTVYSGWENNTVYECYGETKPLDPEKHSDVADVCTEMTFDSNEDAGLKADIAAIIYQAYRSHTKYVTPIPVSDEITKNFVISGNGVDDVNVTMILDTTTYNLVFQLTVAGSSVTDYAMTLAFNASVVSPNKENAETEVQLNADKDHKRLEEFEDEEGIPHWEWVPVEYDITIYTLNTTVSYDGGTITKGV